MGKRAKLHLRSPSLALPPEASPPPTPPSVENCLPQNQSLVPKRLGTAGLDTPSHTSASLGLCPKLAKSQAQGSCQLISQGWLTEMIKEQQGSLESQNIAGWRPRHQSSLWSSPTSSLYR